MLEYNDENHRYEFLGVTVPSVTQIVPSPDFHISDDALEEKKADGKDRHSLIKMYFDTGRDTFGDPLLIMLDEWLKENEYMTGKMLFYERPLYSEKNRFAGTPDMVFEKAVVDFKSSFYSKKYFVLQLAGYDLLLNDAGHKKKRARVVIYPGKKMLMKNVDDPQADRVFMLLLKKWYMEQEIKNYYER